ncbi:MAG: hypothetical protein CMD31_09850 [Flavobacteriales bacterium]|nr:hypothetical protein [Flavobacteriales bacterium]|tara:strand:- start:125783 stop:126595 length:813 start_codon:yes stop_codon:yes gene_type:complete
MKNKYPVLFLIFIFFSLNKITAQEPQFKFHLAFEDATGAKDTIWFILDSSATWGMDPGLGEIPQDLTSNDFHVYLKYNQTDSGKVYAASSCGGLQLLAQNYVYPITLRWDSALLFTNNLPFIINEAILTNDWFFAQANDPNITGAFCLMHGDSVVMPSFTWGSQDHFPLSVTICDNPNIQGHVGVGEYSFLPDDVAVYPNPTNSSFMVSFKNQEFNKKQLTIVDISGRKVYELVTNKDKEIIDLGVYPKGVYFLEILIENEKVVQKIIKN